MDIGSELRQAREGRGLSLDDLSRVTKIRVPALCAIENNDGASLPGGIFTRGFLSASAREVGLDPVDTARRFVAQFEPPTCAVDPATREPDAIERLLDSSEPRSAVSFIGTAGLVLGVPLSFTTLVRWHAPPMSAAPAATGTAATPAARAMSLAPVDTQGGEGVAATSGSFATPAASASVPDVLELDVQTTGPCWVSATADGSRVVYRQLQPGERQRIEGRRELVLRVGDPASFAFSINGNPGRGLGQPGEAMTLRVTPENFSDWVVR